MIINQPTRNSKQYKVDLRLAVMSYMNQCLILLTIIVSTLQANECIYLANSSSLIHHLCGEGRHHVQAGTHLCLLGNVTYDLNSSDSSFCLVSNVNNITIRSASKDGPATITCSQPTGIGFYNVSGLSIKNINIDQCGGLMPSLSWLYPSHDNSFYFPKGQSVTMLFSHSTDIALRSVSIRSFYGYGLLVINPHMNLSLDLIRIENSRSCKTMPHHLLQNCGGTGLVLYFSNYTITTNEPALIDIFNATIGNILGNQNFYSKSPLSPLTYPQAINSIASCTAVLFSKGEYQALVSFKNSTLAGCFESLYNIAIIARDAPIGKTHVSFESTHIEENYLMVSKMNGVIGCFVTSQHEKNSAADEHIKKWDFLMINNSTFHFHTVSVNRFDHNRIFFQIVVESKVKAYVAVALLNINCVRSHFGYRSKIVFAKVIENGTHCRKNLLIELKSFTVGLLNWKMPPKRVDNNGKMVFVNVANVTIHGNSVFKYITGSVIAAYNSAIYLFGNILFENNRATSGGAIRLGQSSHLFLLEQTNATFNSNTAFSYGGAIYSYADRNLPLINSQCAIQIVSNKTNISDINIKLNFFNNTARLAGKAMYVSPSYKCQQLTSPFNTSVLYNAIIHILDNNTMNQIVSVPVRTQLCSINGGNDNKTSYNFYPGQTLTVGLRAVDLNNTSSYAQVFTTLTRQLKYSSLKYYIDIFNQLNAKQRTQVVYSNSCTPLSFQILPIINSSYEMRKLFLCFEVFGYFSTAFIKLVPLNCPLGFVYDKKTKCCTCSFFLKEFNITKCSIDNTAVLIPQLSWLGLAVSRDKSTLEYSPCCPPGYCRTDTQAVNVTHANDICAGNRVGILCGQCSDGYSKALFSSNCHNCNNYIKNMSLLVVSVAGSILYVVLLFCLRFTIDNGTLGGLILWLDVTSLMPSFKLVNNIFKYLLYGISFTVFIWEVPLCVSMGLTSTSVKIIEYFCSFYLWILVGAIVIISRCSTKVSNLTVGSSVQVLVTLMFISFSNLLSISLDILTPAHIHELSTNGNISTTLVWFTDGSVQYGRDPVHVILMCISIAIILCFVVPYILIGLFGFKLLHFRFAAIYLRPFIDAMQGPYKDKQRYWFGLMLIVRSLIHITAAVLQGSNMKLQLLFFIAIIGLYTLGLSLIKPYKNKLLNALELWFCLILLTNLIVSSSCSSLNVIEVITSITISCSAVTCCVILAYHTYISLTHIRWIREQMEMKCCKVFKGKETDEDGPPLPPLIDEDREVSNYYSFTNH